MRLWTFLLPSALRTAAPGAVREVALFRKAQRLPSPGALGWVEMKAFAGIAEGFFLGGLTKTPLGEYVVFFFSSGLLKQIQGLGKLGLCGILGGCSPWAFICCFFFSFSSIFSKHVVFVGAKCEFFFSKIIKSIICWALSVSFVFLGRFSFFGGVRHFLAIKECCFCAYLALL